MASAAKRIFIVDVMAMAFRNFHGFGARPLATSTGQPTSAIYGSLSFMLHLIEREKPDYLIFASDRKEPTFRHHMYPDYKANRSAMPEDLAAQIELLYDMLEKLGGKLVHQAGFEADDIIGSVARQFVDDGHHCYIVSGDKDFMQLISDKVFMLAPKKAAAPKKIDEIEVFEKFSCRPDQVIDVLALMGDSSDNVPGVPGIGEKGAAKLIGAYGDLDGVYDNLAEIKNKRQNNSLSENRDKAYLSKELVTIKTDMDLGFGREECSYSLDKLTNPDLLMFAHEMEFKSMATRIEGLQEKYGSTGDAAANEKTDVKNIKSAKKAADNAGDAVDTDKAPADLSLGLFPAEERARGDYTTIKTLKELDTLLKILDKSPLYALDTETDGLHCLDAKPIGISFGVAEDSSENEEDCKSHKGWYVPLHPAHSGRLNIEKAKEAIKKHFTDNLSRKVMHNAKFDQQMLWNIGMPDLQNFECSMLAAYVIDPTARSFKLDTLVKERLGYEMMPLEALMGPKKKTPLIECPIEEVAAYAAEDADYTLRLFEQLKPELKEKDVDVLYEQIEKPMAMVLARMEQTGMYVEKASLAKFSEELAATAEKLEQKIYKEAGREFNIQSPKQLQVVLFEDLKVHEQLGIRRLKKTKTGFSTNASVLEKLSAHPLPASILEYRGVQKLRNTYVDALPNLVHEGSGRVHTSFLQTGTSTGRLSSQNPNLQNIPIRTALGRRVREAFTSQTKGSVLLSADYSQMELRLLAHMSGDPVLIQAFKDGEDIHASTAAKVFGVEVSEVSSEQRSQAKAINFGIMYGMGPVRLAQQTGVTMVEAKDFIARYFETFPKVRGYLDSTIESAKTCGYAKTLLGRIRPVPNLHSDSPMLVSAAENVAVNTPVQGSAADLIKIAMIRLDQKLRRGEFKSKLVLQVHDELVLEVDEKELEDVRQLTVDSMQTVFELDVPLSVDAGTGKNWLEAH